MIKADDYDVLTEVEDPEVAFLNGSERLEFRQRPVPPANARPTRKRSPRPLQRKPSSCRSPTIWIALLCMLLSGLIVALTVIIYRRSFPDEIRSNSTLPSSTVSPVSYDTLPPDEDGFSSTPDPKGDRTPSSVTSSPSISSCDYQLSRLPSHIRPSFYDLEIETSLPHKNFSGKVLIKLKVLQQTTMVVLHAKDLNILSASLVQDSTDGKTNPNLVSRMQMCHASHQLQLTSRKLLTEGEAYTLEITFQAPLRDDMHGFYSSEYVDITGKNVTLATTQFEDTFASTAFPCFDEPAFKAVFRMQMIHDRRLVALFNTPAETITDYVGKPDVIGTHFKDTPVMSTYLVAFVLCEFGSVSNKSQNGVEVNVYAVAHKLNQTAFALQTAIAVLDFYEKFFGIPYPLPKLDLIAIPDFAAGAMENWGLITFREQSMLFNLEESSLSQMDLVSLVVAHEIAHQWFGNLVTMTWWDQLWLNEGFATFMQHLGADAAVPALASWSRMSATIVQSALTSDALYSTHPIIADIKDASDIASMFDEISYSKGASVLLMLYESLSPTVFQQGVTEYLNKNKYGNAETKDLWASLDNAWHNNSQKHSNDDKNSQKLTIKKVADKWTLQPGFPLITATMDKDRKSISVSQKRISPTDTFAIRPDSSMESWFVPLNYLTASSPKNATSVWLDQPADVIGLGHVEKKWYKLNFRQRGFFRVNYDEQNWVALIDALKEDPNVMSPEDRANLLDDAFSLAWIGRVNLTTAFKLAAYLSNEHHFLPWMTITPYFDDAEAILFETELFMKFRRWRQELIQPVFDSVDCSLVPPEDIPYRRQCVHIFGEACHADLPACVEASRQMFNRSDIPVDLRSVVYRTVIKHGSAKEWNFLWEKYRNTQIASEKSIVLLSLATTQDIWLIERFLRYAFDPTFIRSMESTHVLLSLSKNYVARDAVWRTIRQMWDKVLYVRYGDDPVISGFFYCLHWMTSKRDLDEVEEFFYKPGRKLGSGTLALSQAIETIELRRKFIDNSLETFGKILADY